MTDPTEAIREALTGYLFDCTTDHEEERRKWGAFSPQGVRAWSVVKEAEQAQAAFEGLLDRLDAAERAQRELREKYDAALDMLIELDGELREPEYEEARQRAVNARRWQAMRELYVGVDWLYGEPAQSVALFTLKSGVVRSGPEGADDIADVAIKEQAK